MSLFLACAWIFMAPSRSQAATTAITTYDVEMGVMREGLVLVKETITLHVADASPTEMPRAFSLEQEAPPTFAVNIQTVRLDGIDAPFTAPSEENKYTLTVPVNDRLISGEHTLYLEYSISDLIAYGPESDGFAWNVTGDAWFMPILQAKAVILLPGAADIIDQNASTGRWDNPSKRFFLGSTQEGRPIFETSSPLLPGERLFIELTWPKGVVEQGGGPSLLLGAGMALAAALLSALLILVHRRRNRGSETG